MKSFISAAVAALLLFSNPAEAARGFGSTFGAASTDAVATTYSTSLPTQHSYFCWMWLNGFGGGGGGRIFDAGTLLGVSSTGSLASVHENWFTTAGVWTWPAPSTGKWVPLVVTYDGSSASNLPIVYQDKTVQTVTTATPPVGGYSGAMTTFRIGNRSDGTRNFDGKIAELTIWSGILTSNEAAQLAAGVSPMFIRPSSILFYMPLTGVGSGEPDWGPTHRTQTLTGTAFQPHPPVFTGSLFPSR